VRDCRRILKVMDDENDGEISRAEMVAVFRCLGIAMIHRVVEELYFFLDRDGSGTLSRAELYLGLRGEMSPQRAKLVSKCHDDLVRR